MSSRAPTFPAIVAEIEQLSSRVRRVVLDVPCDYAWEPGQHLALQNEVDAPLRYYSIASARSSASPGRLELVMGESSDAAPLEAGAQLLVTSPGGARAIPRGHDARAVLVGVGTGVAPLRAVVLERSALGLETALLVGFRTAGDALFHGEFAALARAEQLRYFPVLSQPSSEWTGLVGRVQEHLDAVVDDEALREARFAVCGSRSMVDDIVLRLTNAGASRTRIFAEGH